MLRPPLVVALLILALACCRSTPAAASTHEGAAPARRWLVTLADGRDVTATQAQAAKAGLKVDQTLDCAGALVVTSSDDADKVRARLSTLDGVASVEPDDPVPAPSIVGARHVSPPPPPAAAPLSGDDTRDHVQPDDEYWPEQWNMRQIEAVRAWDYTTGSADAFSTIAILDTGIDLDHPDLGGSVFVSAGWNFFDNNDNIQDVSQSGSGTMVAGVIAATANNGVGIVGLAWNAQIIPIKVVGRDPISGTDVFYWSQVVAGLCRAVEQGARVIHVSVYHRTLNAATAMYRALTFAESAGAVVVAPVGDERRYGNPTEYPAAYQRLVVGVGAVDQSAMAWDDSNAGSYVGVVAPGVDVVTTVPMAIDDVGMRRGTGTILAAAHVSGAALLLLAINPRMTVQDVGDVLRRSADDLGLVGPDTTYGAGRINVRRAVEQTPHRLTVSPTDALVFEWNEQDGAYRQPYQSLSNNNTGPTTWTTHAMSPWISVTPPVSADPGGTTPSIASLTITPPAKGECGTRAGMVRAESTMPNRVEGRQDIVVRAYLPPCPPRPYSIFLPRILVAPPEPVAMQAPARGRAAYPPPAPSQ